MSYAILFNRLSGRRSAHWNNKLINRLTHALPEPLTPYDVEDPASLNTAMTDILTSGVHSLIISGGDGTLNRVINALLRHPDRRDLKLALIPNGTGNSFALDLGIKQLDDTLTAIKQGHLVNADIGRIRSERGEQFFINNFGIGLVYDITRLASKLRPLGALSYIIATLVKLIRLPKLDITLTADGEKQTATVLFLDICNSRFTGGDMNMAPDVTLTDGQFQMVWVPPISQWTLLKTFPKLFSGTHLQESFVHHQMVQRVELAAGQPVNSILDGDLTDGLPFSVEMTEQKLTFYTLR